MSEDIIEEEVIKARKIFEQYSVNISKAYFGSFPNRTCGDVCEILARWLSHKGVDNLTVACGEREGQSHAWLEVNDLIIDITSDQFEDGVGPIFVSTDSTFHDSFLGKIYYQPRRKSCLMDSYNKFKNYMVNTLL